MDVSSSLPSVGKLTRPVLKATLVAAIAVTWVVSAHAADSNCPNLLQRDMPRLQDEKLQPLCQYAGKVVLVVNTASFCGFTSQYKALETLSSRYADKGLVVLGFPSNDFGNQEPGSNKDIAEFCENTFNVKFPMFSKSVVLPNKAGLNPLFADLIKRTNQAPKWNFHKYMIARDGREVLSFGSTTDPLSANFTRELDRLLAQAQK